MGIQLERGWELNVEVGDLTINFRAWDWNEVVGWSVGVSLRYRQNWLAAKWIKISERKIPSETADFPFVK